MKKLRISLVFRKVRKKLEIFKEFAGNHIIFIDEIKKKPKCKLFVESNVIQSHYSFI